MLLKKITSNSIFNYYSNHTFDYISNVIYNLMYRALKLGNEIIYKISQIEGT